jgi:hypothetical protein
LEILSLGWVMWPYLFHITWISALRFVHISQAISEKFLTPVVFIEVFWMFTQENAVASLWLVFSTLVAVNLPIW